jgi:hypothetical protein
MGRQIVNTNGQGLASSTALKFAIASIIVGIIVLLIFYGLNRSQLGDRSTTMSTASFGALSPEAK